MNRFFNQGKGFLAGPQNTIPSAALIIMVMVLFSSLLGVVRLRVFAHYFTDAELSLFFASFRLPDLVFQLLAFGIFSSAFIPVFTKVHTKDRQLAFDTSSRLINITLLAFLFFSVFFAIFARVIYSIFAPGYSTEELYLIAELSRLILVAQGLFIVSYVVTGMLESLRRFFIAALAPVFYNVGIILATITLEPYLHLYAPVAGVLIGAFLHLAIQLPAVTKLGFKFSFSLRPNNEVKKIGKLAVPRVLELAVLQVSKLSELFFTSIIATASLTYYIFADAVRVVPITLFGVSMAKAALPTLAAVSDNNKKFKKTFLKTVYQISFLVMPVVAALVVLRIPVVRILFGADKFEWEATIQTGLTLSVFALSIPFQSAAALLSRAFYAKHNTKTPVKISIIGVIITVTLSAMFVLGLGWQTWSLALAYTLGMAFQAIALFYLLSRELNGRTLFAVAPMLKSVLAATVSGLAMFVVIKLFDRSVWVKRLSFVADIQVLRDINFESFVVDTRYTFNLVLLTGTTAVIGVIVYILVSFLLRSSELRDFTNLVRGRKFSLSKKHETESLTDAAEDLNRRI